MLLQTRDGCVLGGFSAESWKARAGFFGSGECFVFRCRASGLDKYAWSGANTFFMTSASEGMGMGGGTGFAWWIDSALVNGSSNPSSTYGSPRLADHELFELTQLEVWGIV